MSVALHERRRRLVARQAIRAWEYRQRHAAKGVWLRLRRLLAGAEYAAIVDADTARVLIEEGHSPEPIGLELEPAKTILVLPRERFDELGRRPIAVALSAELLTAANLVLVPFS